MLTLSQKYRKSMLSFLVLIGLFISLLAIGSQHPLLAQENVGDLPDDSATWTEQMRRFVQNQGPPLLNVVSAAADPCVGGMAGIYPCNNVDLLAHISLGDMNATGGNDSWGWTDALDGKEYALMGLNNGTAFVDISDPENPVYLGKLPTHSINSTWRDIKVYADHAFIVSEAGGHGMQVFDLTELRNVVSPPVTFSETAHYNQIGNAHNIVINEDSGYAYAVGTSTCSGGLHMIDISTPTSPTNAGCFSGDGYTHDAQCIVYDGPDTVYQGSEICLNSNADTLTIVDVTNKAAPVQLSRTGYTGVSYTHQGWITEDHTYFLLNDEADETSNGHNTRTYIWDLTDLDAPVVIGNYTAVVASIDHNLYTKGNYVFEANYTSGLRILDTSDIANANLTEAAYFDTYPENNNASFDAAWNNYPYFDSGVVIISDGDRGLFIVKPHLVDVAFGPDQNMSALPGETVTYTVGITNVGTLTDTFDLSVSGASWVTTLSDSSVMLNPGESMTLDVSVDVPGGAAAGDSDTAVVSAAAQSNPGITSDVELMTWIPLWAVGLDSTDVDLTGAPGVTVTYTVNISNSGNMPDTYNLSVSGNGWPTAVSPGNIALDPGQSSNVSVVVDIPVAALGNATDTVTLTANGQVRSVHGGASDSIDLTTTANAIYGVTAAAADDAQPGTPGMTVTYTIYVTNTGNITDTFDLSASGVWTATVTPSSLELGYSQSGMVQVTVAVPSGAGVGEAEATTLTVTSQGAGNVTADVMLTTTAGELETYFVYLPIMVKGD